jgi:hypothetical protein
MRVLVLLAILSLAACGSAGSGVSPATSTPAASPSETAPVRAPGPSGAPIASMSVTGAHAYIRAQVTQSAPVLLPETTALPTGVKADVMARPDSFTITYSDERGVRIFLGLVAANPGPMSARGTQRTLSFRGDPRALAQIDDASLPLGHRFVIWREPATKVAPSSDAYDVRAGVLPYFLSSDGIDDPAFWKIANSLRP